MLLKRLVCPNPDPPRLALLDVLASFRSRMSLLLSVRGCLSLYISLQGFRGHRKSVVSIKFPPVILGPEMAAPVLWAPVILWFFLLENPHAHRIPPFRGGGVHGFFWKGGGSAGFIFMGVGIFPIEGSAERTTLYFSGLKCLLAREHGKEGQGSEPFEKLKLQKLKHGHGSARLHAMVAIVMVIRDWNGELLADPC